MKRRCVLVIPDAGPINSLWVARRLDLLLMLEMPVVLIDEVYAETTRDPDHYAKDRDVKSFVEVHRGKEIIVEQTFVGTSAAAARAKGDKLKANLGDAAIAEFLNDGNADTGVNKYLQSDEPVLLLFEDADLKSTKFIKKSDKLHLLSTVAFLRGMEAVGLLESADEIIQAMTYPGNPRESRKFGDLPDGTDEEARIGSVWKPIDKGQ